MQATDDKIIRHMRLACWIPKATNIHSEYVILIALYCKKWLRERALTFVKRSVLSLSCFI